MFDNFGLTYWGLQARMQQSLESARVARVTQGKEITATTGFKHQGDESVEKPWASHVRYPCACLQSWASGLSQKHLAAYALDCQTSLNRNLLPGDAAYMCSTEMLAAVGALVEMQGIVRMMQHA